MTSTCLLVGGRRVRISRVTFNDIRWKIELDPKYSRWMAGLKNINRFLYLLFELKTHRCMVW